MKNGEGASIPGNRTGFGSSQVKNVTTETKIKQVGKPTGKGK